MSGSPRFVDWLHSVDSWRVCAQGVRRVMADDPEADDAVQEAMIRAWRQARRGFEPDDRRSWLKRVGEREALRIHARRRDVHVLDEELPDDDERLEDRSVRNIDLRHAVRGLVDVDRRLVYLRYWEELDDHEISRRTGVTPPTVRVRLHRARLKLAA